MNARKHNAFLTCISFGALWATGITGDELGLTGAGGYAKSFFIFSAVKGAS
jgi:hypothetical protein